MVVGSQWSLNEKKNVFWYQGEWFKVGLPRNDIIIQNDSTLKQKIRNHLSLAKDSLVVLYAPTFRNEGGVSCYALDYLSYKEVLETKFEKTVQFLVRLHSNVRREK